MKQLRAAEAKAAQQAKALYSGMFKALGRDKMGEAAEKKPTAVEPAQPNGAGEPPSTSATNTVASVRYHRRTLWNGKSSGSAFQRVYQALTSGWCNTVR